MEEQKLLLTSITKVYLTETRSSGGVAEWLNALVLKTSVPSRVPGVRISPPPPNFETNFMARANRIHDVKARNWKE